MTNNGRKRDNKGKEGRRNTLFILYIANGKVKTENEKVTVIV